ncbi:DoxX family protein [Streptomyces sp. NPDC093589]|uniref:DoxX family protein n=1 Tax=Streptomyces sp. NPDC093589 TaxID=3366043 RepID=UPI0037F1F680
MPTAAVVTLVAAAMTGFSAAVSLLRVPWAEASMTAYGVPRSWWPWLGRAEAAGAIGLLVGLFVPVVGVAAGTGLVLYFAGAVLVVARAGRYAHLPFPLLYAAPVAGAPASGFGV